jgi:DNA-binding LytR/AlgR family response regulator
LYSNYIGLFDLNWTTLLLFELYTAAIGIFPIAGSVLINQIRLNKKFVRQSEQISKQIHVDHPDTDTTEGTPVVVISENGTVELELLPNHFVYAKADDNYVEIFYLQDSKISRKIIRNTLKTVFQLLSEENHIFRCHKSYLVNLNKVQHISGNAQGYKLHVSDVDEQIPVSRSHNDFIKNYFTS